ncbi:TetR family transcriptional regulator C-terminal domain-containing protein [Marinobacterium lacunae]|uniref:TetR family transcriptional regulator C-terminal domain-containing protein n=1 Tax=Marinobacterium lacunae TaxID=1232683 RepID=UPI0009DDAB04
MNAATRPPCWLNTFTPRSKSPSSTEFQDWIDKGLVAHINPNHLLFIRWAATQQLTQLMLKGCGVQTSKTDN